MTTTEKKPRRRKGGIRGNADALREIRVRIAKVYGFTDLDFDRLDDDELVEVDGLARRVVRVEFADRHRTGADLMRIGNDRKKADQYVASLKKTMADNAALLSTGPPHLRESTERLIGFAQTHGRMPSQTERDAITAGRPLSSGAEMAEVVNFADLSTEEVEMFETLSAKLAGLAPSHFADARVAAKIRELAARLEPRPEPRRMPRRDEPGSVTLPAELFTAMAKNYAADGDWMLYSSAAAVAALALILHAFADPGSPLVDQMVFASFNESNDVLHCRNDHFPFHVRTDPNGEISTRWRQSLQLLTKAGWLETRGLEIRLGKRSLELFEQPKQDAKAPAIA